MHKYERLEAYHVKKNLKTKHTSNAHTKMHSSFERLGVQNDLAYAWKMLGVSREHMHEKCMNMWHAKEIAS